MTYHHIATKLVAAALAGFAFAGSAIGQEPPHLVGDFSASIDNVVPGPMPRDEGASAGSTTEQGETSTFAYTNEELDFPRPRTIDESAHGNFSANIREDELRN